MDKLKEELNMLFKGINLGPVEKQPAQKHQQKQSASYVKRRVLKEEMYCTCDNPLKLVRIYGRGTVRYGVWCDHCNVTDSISVKLTKEI